MKTKQCTKCKKKKPTTEFYKDSRQSSGVRPECKECTKEAQRLTYQTNEDSRAKKLATAEAYIKGRRVEIQKRILTILKQTGCVDCGETDPIVLDFDHQRDKVASVSRLLRDHSSWEKIQTEIAKCEVRCSNCHRRKTAKERNWYATIDLAAL